MVTTLVERARLLAGQHLAGLPDRRAHVRGVASVAAEVAEALDSQHAEAIACAAWLHDVGYAPAVANTGFHPLDGARYAEEQGFPALVVSLVAYHTGAVFEAEQRGDRNALAEFALPPSDLLDIVTYADMTTAPDGSRVAAADRLAEILSRYEDTDPVYAAVSRSGPELLASVARVQDRLREASCTLVQPR